MVMSLLGLGVVVLPLYFIANALQATMQQTISAEAHQYFGFVVVGAVAFSLISTCATALPMAVDSAIGRGTLELMLGTPARLGAICTGLMGYGVMWSVLRATIVVAVASWLGAGIVWRGIPLGIAVLALTMLSYAGIGLIFTALVLNFRTAGPLPAGVLTASMFLGGVYYPAHVIPSWIRDLSGFFPLTYGLRALRQVLLRGDPLSSVLADVQTLSAMTTVTLAVGVGLFWIASQRARRVGTLSSY
jgi:ABC-2 type transport system permease protein